MNKMINTKVEYKLKKVKLKSLKSGNTTMLNSTLRTSTKS